MPRRIPDLHWADGQLLRPQHLQAFQQHCHDRIGDLARVRTYGYGIRHLELRSESIGNWELEVTGCELVMRDGTSVVAGETAVLASKDFHALRSDASVLEVWLGIPFPRARAANVFEPAPEAPEEPVDVGERFLGVRLTLPDENTGGNPQEIAVKLLNGRLFVGERPPEGHATFKLAELRKVVTEGEEGRRYELSSAYVPACLRIDAAPQLKGVLVDVLHQVEQKNQELLGHLKGRKDLLTGEALDRPETLLKLQATNAILPVLRQLEGHPEMHPFDVFLALSRLVGELAIFSEDWTPPKLALYDHDNPNASFQDLKRVTLALLDNAVDTTVERRTFEAGGPGEAWSAELPPSFAASGVDLLLGIETTRPEAEVAGLFQEGRTVLAAPNWVQDVLRRRIDGVACTRVANLHPSLSDRTGMVFLQLHPEGRFWDEAVLEGRMALLGEALDSGTDRFFLYAVGLPREAR